MNAAFHPPLPLVSAPQPISHQIPHAARWSAVQTTSAPRTFGRGLQQPRRPVSLNELKRLKIPPPPINPPLSEKALTATVGTLTFATLTLPLLTPNSEAPLASLVGLLLTAWAVDTLALKNKLSSAALLLAGGKKRVATHEAGHFVVAYLLGVQPVSSTLPSALGVLRGEQMGVGVEAVRDVYKMTAVGMGGIAAEIVRYGGCEGGAEDMAEVGRVVQSVSETKRGDVVRWGLLQAVSLLRRHADVLEDVAEVLAEGGSVEECISVVEAGVSEDDLVRV